MRFFSSATEAVKEVERDLWEMGTRVHTKSYQDKNQEGGYDTKELVGYSFALLAAPDWADSFVALGYEDPEACVRYTGVEADARTRCTGLLNPGDSYLFRESVWKKFLEADGKFAYTYPERIFENFGLDQLTQIDNLHRSDPGSRQLVAQIYQQEVDGVRRGGLRRVPCTMHYQFLHRDNVLTLIHNMRSCDLYTHFAIDMCISWLMVRATAHLWEIECPRLVMQIGSLHAFKNDMEKRRIF